MLFISFISYCGDLCVILNFPYHTHNLQLRYMFEKFVFKLFFFKWTLPTLSDCAKSIAGANLASQLLCACMFCVQITLRAAGMSHNKKGNIYQMGVDFDWVCHWHYMYMQSGSYTICIW